MLSREHLDDDAWEEVEDALLTADVGVGATNEIVERLKERTRVLGTRSQGELRALLAEELVLALKPGLDRTLHVRPSEAGPAVLMVVGVNGTGKTTTCGKLARVLVADGSTVLLGAADTFRAAAADQLTTWGERVGRAHGAWTGGWRSGQRRLRRGPARHGSRRSTSYSSTLPAACTPRSD